jgi:hypothetical protein
VSGEGVREALFALAREIGRTKKEDATEKKAPKARWRP